jgi:6-pyruvoyltetrahydropterin/6-carboxytetrahydropterin synthase
MNTVFLTRRERFNAAHRMFRPEWSDEKNLEIFGKCSNPLWHGHNYILFITVKGKINPETGCLVNLTLLSQIIRREIIDKVDHKNLNLEVNFMEGKIVSSENLAVEIWKQLEPRINQLGVKLHCVKIEETENNFVEYFGN